MNKRQIFTLVGVLIINIAIITFVVLKGEQTTEPIATKILQVNSLQKLINEPGLDYWRISSFNNDTTFYLIVEFNSAKDARVTLRRTFRTSADLDKNINSILEEARKLR